jgi:hypothetical protein
MHWTTNPTPHSVATAAEPRTKRSGAAVLAQSNVVAG